MWNTNGDLFHRTSGGINADVVDSNRAGQTILNTISYSAVQNFHLSANYTQPANKTGTVSLTPVMLGANATFTPRYTDNATVTVTGLAADSTLADGCRVAIQKYTFPTPFGNGRAVVAGNEKGTNLKIISPTAASTTPFALIYEDQALTGQTKYVYDLDFAALTGGTCTITNVSWDIREHIQ